jgi:hypothetical protein
LSQEVDNSALCETAHLSREPTPQVSTKKRVQAPNTLDAACQHNLILSISINTTPKDLKDTDCKKGHVVQWPPTPYVPVTSILKTSTLTESIKVKLNAASNLICLEVFEDGDKETYLRNLMTLQHLQATKGVEEKLLLARRELVDKNKILKVLCVCVSGLRLRMGYCNA